MTTAQAPQLPGPELAARTSATPAVDPTPAVPAAARRKVPGAQMAQSGPVARGMNTRLRALIAKLSFAGFLLLVWQIVFSMKVAPAYLFPGPADVMRSLLTMARSGELGASFRQSMSRMLAAYSISVAVGLVIGVLAARSWLFKETVGSLILSLQSLPSICWLPLALIWVGINEWAILAVVILGATFSIAVATEGAIRNIPPIYQKVGRVLGARGVVFARDVLFFAALPELVGGLKLGWTFAWRSLMAAELIRQDVLGIGRMLETGRQFNDAAQMIAAMLVILVIGLLVDSLVFGTLERHIRRRWGLSKD